MNNGYFLGLDMGTNSVGWAVTDFEYNLLRVKGKDFWGIREFDEASHAQERRSNRISRRRRQKEQVRMGLIKNYFHDAIGEVDPNFFARLENSKYHLEDKDENAKSKYVIFNDTDYTDADYFKMYPTIFHLRQELIHNENPHDVRLVYLAISNMFKHRGHFLYEGLGSSESIRDMQTLYDSFMSMVNDSIAENDSLAFPVADGKKINEILGKRDISRSRKSELIAELLQVDKKDKRRIEFVKCICGLKTDATNLFLLETEEKVEINFSDSGYEDKIGTIAETIGDENFTIVEVMKEMYDVGILSGILKEHTFLSDARVEAYNKHKDDLKLLKKVIRKFGTEKEYDAMFRSDEAASYSVYVNSYNSGTKQRRDMGGVAKQEDLYKKISGLLNKYDTSNDDVAYILNEIKNENFLPKQLIGANGVIPNQVHAREIKAILKNAEGYLSFLKDKDESGLTVSERIIQLFSFHVPYYIGPVTENSANNHGNGWVVRKESGPVYPWNIDEKIDREATSEKFIERLIRECTYISGQKVLPKASLEYEAFCVLNEINNLKIDGERIDVELKQKIYKELFESGKKISRSKLESYLKNLGKIASAEQISGIDKTINNSLSSFGKFKAIFGEDIYKDETKKIVENIIRISTIYGDSKSRLKEAIEREYADKLTPEQIKRILGYKFKDWGNMSKEFLELQGCDKSTGEISSLIRAMWDNNLNLMELINSDGFTYKTALEEKRTDSLSTLSDLKNEDLDDYYFSAPVKRMIWQTVLLIKEITKIMGAEPTKIFVEMTRSEEEKGDKGRKASRKKQLLDFYSKVKEEMPNWKELIEKSDADGSLKSKKMYLYLKQLGRDMYTGKPIDLDDLFNDNIYDIDHIYPQCYVKDNNLENNMVLVNKNDNENIKKDDYPIPSKIADKPEVKALWHMLREKGLINDEKYNRLMSRKPFTEDQMAGFIARQMVETGQATKGFADIIKTLCKDTEIVYSKAGNVSDFRKKYDLIKSRLVNDFHHANDAYLNIVVGNAYNVKFTKNPYNFIKKEYASDKKKYHYHLGKIFERDIIRDGNVGWIAEHGDNHGTIATVKKVMAKNTPLMTRMNFENKGAIANATLYSAKKATPGTYIPIKGADEKMQDVSKYGGMTSVSTAYFALVESEKKGKLIRTIEAVPVIIAKRIQKDKTLFVEYCKKNYELVNPRIIIPKIKIQSLMKVNGYYVHLSGKTNNQLLLRNAVNLCLKQEWVEYCHDLEINKSIDKKKNIEIYNILTDKFVNSIYAKRPNSVGTKLINAKETFLDLEIEKQKDVLLQLLNLTVIGITAADLSLVNEAKICGKMLMSKNISGNEEIVLINQSITGIYEEHIDLLKA